MTLDSLLIASPIAPTLELRRRRRCLGVVRRVALSSTSLLTLLSAGLSAGGSARRRGRMRVEAVDQVAAVAVQRRVLAASSGSISLSGAGRMHAAVLAHGDQDVQLAVLATHEQQPCGSGMQGSRLREPHDVHGRRQLRTTADIAMVHKKKLGPALFWSKKQAFYTLFSV